MADSLGTIYAELRLKLDQFKQDVANATTEIKNMQQDASTSLSAFADMGNQMKNVGGTLSKYVTAPIVGLGTASVHAFTQFEEAMSKVKAVAGMTGDELQSMTDLALEMGAKTKFSALEAANAMYELTKLGFDANEMMTALPATMDLAAAGEVDLAQASVIVAQAMNVFGESASQTTRYADVFAKAAAMGALDVTTLGEALSLAGPSAAAMGYSLEETAAALAVFSDAGIDSTRAGTAFEALMRDMKKNAMDSGGALKFMGKAGEEVSISLYDINGKTRPLVDIIRDLETATAGMTDAQRDAALANVANTEGLRGLNVLLGKGADYLQTYTDEIYNSSGAGDEMARTMQDNLAGSLEQLGGALETAGIAFGEVLAPVIRDIADGIKTLVEWFVSLSPEGKKIVAIVGAIVAAIGPLLFIIGTILAMIPAIATGFGMVSAVAAPVILPILAIVAAIAAVIAIGVLLYKNWDKIKEFAGNLWEGIKSGWTNVVEGIKNLFTGIGEFFVGIWDSIKTTFTDAFTAIVEWFTSLPERIATGLENFVTAVGTWIENVVTFFSELPGKVLTFLQKLFFEDIPYWVGYGLGTMVRLVIEGIEKTVKFFRELPGKILEFLTELWEYISTKWTEMKETMTRLATEAIKAVVKFFSELPGKVLNWLQNTWTNIQTKFTEMKQTMITRATEAINSVVTFFSELPGRIWTWLVNTVGKIKNFGTDALAKAKGAGQQIVDGFISIVKGLPGLIWDTLMSVGSKLTEAGSALWKKAKGAARRLWEGFKDGIGKHSPSYLEEAMFDIVDTGKWMLDSMKSDFRTLGNVKVNPPSLSNMGSTLKQSMNEVSRLIGGDQQFAFAGAVTGPTEQVVRHEHTGVLEIRGTNDEGQFVDAVRVVMDELRREVRT
jgi:TP901 family phage tail tape measure protein